MNDTTIPQVDRPDVDDIRAQYWPLDARDADLSVTAAEMIAELVRYLNHASMNGTSSALPYAGTIYQLVSQLGGAMRGMEQLLRQLATRCQTLAEDDPTVRHDGLADPDRSLTEAKHELFMAAEELLAVKPGPIGDRLGEAQRHLTWIGHVRTDGAR